MLITVGRYLNAIEAHIVKGRIEAEGISAYVHHEHHIWADWTISLALGFVKIQVRPEDAAAACIMIEKFHAGEFSLEEEDEYFVSACPSCGCARKERVIWPAQLALAVFMIFSLAIPYSNHWVKCVECKNIWTQKELRGYPLWVLAFVIFMITFCFFVLESTFYYICKMNYLSDACI